MDLSLLAKLLLLREPEYINVANFSTASKRTLPINQRVGSFSAEYFMFKSKVRPINVPQYEHGRLSGAFALLWGNEVFDRPEFNFDSFVQGVALHEGDMS